MKSTRILVVWVGTLTRQQHVFTLVNFLAQNGFSIEIAHFGQDASPQRPVTLDGSIRLSSFAQEPGRTLASVWTRLRAIWKLAGIMRHSQYDIVYVINSWTLPIFWPARLCLARRCATVYHTFDWLEPGLNLPIHRFLEKQVCRWAHLVVNTDRTRARLQQSLYGLKRCPLHLPIYLSRAVPLPDNVAELRKDLLSGLKAEEPVVLIYPTIAGKERLTCEILEAFRLLPPKYVLVTIAADDAYGQQVRRVAQSEGLQGRVKIYQPMPHNQVVNLIAASDIGAIFHDVTSSSGNFMGSPSRLALFVACGIPFVAVATPNVEAQVYKHHLGICCDPTNPHELADSILKLVNDPPGLAARKAHLRRVFEEELHFEKHAGVLARELKRLV